MGGTFTLTLPAPRADLTAAKAEAAMELINSKNMFVTTGGELIEKKDIKITDSTTTDLYDPPLY
ncbi:DUF2922 domain-containing protein [Desulfosporosinus nitroreducens]|uniref:DUF2922 domain-containing protein n=1 Tax=Desulfosporosinus nitroreducens TaxID=2018668 RepID=UPI003F527411